VNRDPGKRYYVSRPGEFSFIPGVVDSVRSLQKGGFKVFIVSNQSGIARGVVKREALREITQHMLRGFDAAGAKVEGVFYCEHDDADGCACRKPKSGLYETAVQGMGVNRALSFSIGDSERDIEAGKRFGCQSLLVLSGKSKTADVQKFKTQPDQIFTNMGDAAEWILGQSTS
jgi:histidinol-phosphate phosphatase family protein